MTLPKIRSARSLRLLAPAFALVLSASALAQGKPSIAGSWAFDVNVQGIGVKTTCTFIQTADAATGTCDTPTGTGPAANIKITADTVMFSHDGNYEGTPYTMMYTGKVAADGTSMAGTVDVTPFGVGGDFSGKRVPPPTAPAQPK